MRTPIGMHYKFSDERIVYKMNADENGNLYVPVSGRNHSNSPTAPYDWMVSVDGDTPVNYSGTGSDGGVITLSGYAAGSNHTITIIPVTEEYGWALAYGWYNTACASLLTNVHYDGSYKGYGSSATQTGGYFRAYQYYGCSSLTTAPDEVIPNTVTTTSSYFRHYQYSGCTSLTRAADEVAPFNITSGIAYFRSGQYYGCSALTTAADEVLSNGAGTGSYFRSYQYRYCTSLISPAKEALPAGLTYIGVGFRNYQYNGCTSLISAAAEVMPSGVVTLNTDFRLAQYSGCSALVNAAAEKMVEGITTISNGFRYSQYNGCTSLINAPAEVLPTSVTSIGAYFRREQYRGCTSLAIAPDEVMSNGVTSIGNYFRGNQYYGCTSLTSAKLIAKNFENPSNKRYQQFTNAGNTTNPMIITIYGGEMEANMQSNSCGLANANVSFIYVQPNLVEQYQQAAIRSNIDDVKFGPLEEIVYRMVADDNGNLYVPVGGRYYYGSSNAPYNWNVAIDGDGATNYSGTGSAGGSITFSGYTPGTNHIIKISPVSVTYGRARAFGRKDTAGAPYLTEVVYDGSYTGYGISATSAGPYFRSTQYQGCTSLSTAPSEVLLQGVTAIGESFRESQYAGCTSLISIPNEVMPSTVTSIGTSFRQNQYYQCTSLTTPSIEALSTSITSIPNYFRRYQYRGCTSLTSASDEVLHSGITSIGNEFRLYQYLDCTSLVDASDEVLPDTVTSIGNGFRRSLYSNCPIVTAPDEVMSSSITSIGSSFRYQQYTGCKSLTSAKLIANNIVDTNTKRSSQFTNAGNATTPMTITISGSEVELGMSTNSCGLSNPLVATIYVPSALVQGYQDADVWSNITDSKFVGY